MAIDGIKQRAGSIHDHFLVGVVFGSSRKVEDTGATS
jgi:hypothetical protein